MIIVRLAGGLGNQMFQYACAKALALSRKDSLYIDSSFLDANQSANDKFIPRNYELNLFSLKDTKLLPSLILFGKDLSFRVRKLATKLGFLAEIKEKGEGIYDNDLQKNANKNLLLVGNWQSPLYFQTFAAEIRKDFEFQVPLSAESRRIANQIAETNSVCLHIRRGDYVSLSVNQNSLGALNLEYYKAAISLMAEKINQPHFFLFSDDPAWVMENLALNYPYTLVNVNSGKDSWQDMALMTKCKHNIIANSSFSWWGAWLGTNPDKIVIAPEPWFKGIPMPNIHAESWIKTPSVWY